MIIITVAIRIGCIIIGSIGFPAAIYRGKG
jgi:hypothetical protein